MHLIYFIRVLVKNSILIGGVAVFMALLVFLLTLNKAETYTSEMVIYTGLATGYDIESGGNARYDHFMTNAQFDNVINLIKSRQTQEETAIRLMTQHLMLDNPDKRFCNKDTWEAIHDEVPREIKSLIHYPDLDRTGQLYDLPSSGSREAGLTQTAVPSQKVPQELSEEPAQTSIGQTEELALPAQHDKPVMEKQRIAKTRSSPKYYTVKAGDYPIAIAGKFGITLERLKELNSPDAFPLTGGQQLKVGYVKEEYFVDTLIEVQKEPDSNQAVMQEKFSDPYPDPIVPEFEHEISFGTAVDPVKQMDSISENFDHIYDEALMHVEAFERSVRNLIKYKEQDQTNYIYTTLQSSNPVYGIAKISRVKASRMQNSDLLRLTYESSDQGVCQQTLYFLYEVFRKEYQSMKGAQTSMVSDYFRQQRDAAKIRLDSLEEYNKRYRMQNRIINYNEQTKFIAEQNEVLDRDWYDESARLSAAKAALYILEKQMDGYAKTLVQRAEILDLRKELSRLVRLISMEEIKLEPDIELLTQYKLDRQMAKDQMDEYVSSAFRSARTTEGIDMETVLKSWLDKVVEVEESRAKYEVKSTQKREFMRKYDLFAPLGSTLNKIEREIGLAEQEYLNQTHSLDLSLLKQKNSEQSNIRIIDEPYYPIKPNPSRRKLIVLAAFMAGLFLTASVIILLEFLDNTIKFPERAEQLSKNKLLGAYPRIQSKPDPKVNFDLITTRLTDMMTQKIKLEELNMGKGSTPVLILLISSRPNEGKTFIGSRLVRKMRSLGHKVLFIKTIDHNKAVRPPETIADRVDDSVVWDFEYEVPDNFMSIRNVNELIRNFSFITSGYQYIFIELPALLSSDFPATLVSKADMSLMVCKATRTWNRADDEVLDLYKKNAQHKVFSIINGVQIDHLESIIGEIPRNRSMLRILLKKIVRFDFNFVRGL